MAWVDRQKNEWLRAPANGLAQLAFGLAHTSINLVQV